MHLLTIAKVNTQQSQKFHNPFHNLEIISLIFLSHTTKRPEVLMHELESAACFNPKKKKKSTTPAKQESLRFVQTGKLADSEGTFCESGKRPGLNSVPWGPKLTSLPTALLAPIAHDDKLKLNKKIQLHR
jgi:hypothetical protein